jgi:hypothetical protein
VSPVRFRPSPLLDESLLIKASFASQVLREGFGRTKELSSQLQEGAPGMRSGEKGELVRERQAID